VIDEGRRNQDDALWRRRYRRWGISLGGFAVLALAGLAFDSLSSFLAILLLIPSGWLFWQSVRSLYEEGTGAQGVSDRKARRALKWPILAASALSGLIWVSTQLPKPSTVWGAISANLANVLLVAGVGLAFWSMETRRLGLRRPPPGTPGLDDDEEAPTKQGTVDDRRLVTGDVAVTEHGEEQSQEDHRPDSQRPGAQDGPLDRRS